MTSLLQVLDRLRSARSRVKPYKCTIGYISIEGNGTVRIKTSSSWDDLHKREFFTGTIYPEGFAQRVKSGIRSF